jgi:hypothetical protein
MACFVLVSNKLGYVPITDWLLVAGIPIGAGLGHDLPGDHMKLSSFPSPCDIHSSIVELL